MKGTYVCDVMGTVEIVAYEARLHILLSRWKTAACMGRVRTVRTNSVRWHLGLPWCGRHWISKFGFTEYSCDVSSWCSRIWYTGHANSDTAGENEMTVAFSVWVCKKLSGLPHVAPCVRHNQFCMVFCLIEWSLEAHEGKIRAFLFFSLDNNRKTPHFYSKIFI